MKLTEKQINEIAEQLDCGLRCFYNRKTGEIKMLINQNHWIGADETLWEEDSDEIDENWPDYFEFEGFETHESFKIMADFADTVDNPILQKKLFNALNKSRPFRNFKWLIDNSGEYRQQWFDYKHRRYVDWVKEQIDIEQRSKDNLTD